MKQKIFFLVILSGVSITLNAQYLSPVVIASSGESFKQSSASIEWSLGEVVIETFKTDNNSITHGVQQPEIIITDILENKEALLKITIYPVPFTEFVNVSTEVYTKNLRIEIFDFQGRVVYIKNLESTFSTLDLSILPSAEYLLNVLDNQNRLIKTIKLLKK